MAINLAESLKTFFNELHTLTTKDYSLDSIEFWQDRGGWEHRTDLSVHPPFLSHTRFHSVVRCRYTVRQSRASYVRFKQPARLNGSYIESKIDISRNDQRLYFRLLFSVSNRVHGVEELTNSCVPCVF
jgi:hypothetical protein